MEEMKRGNESYPPYAPPPLLPPFSQELLSFEPEDMRDEVLGMLCNIMLLGSFNVLYVYTLDTARRKPLVSVR